MRRETSLVSVLQGIRVLGRDVLKERPTEGDIEQLTTQTNAQHRFAQLSHRFRQSDFKLGASAHGIIGHGGRVRRFAVKVGRDVTPAAENDTI
jgi:hypothetical protein